MYFSVFIPCDIRDTLLSKQKSAVYLEIKISGYSLFYLANLHVELCTKSLILFYCNIIRCQWSQKHLFSLSNL